MAIETQNELQRFHDFVGEQLSNGGHDSSPEEILDMWRSENPSPEEHAANVAAVREAISDMEAGDTGRPAKDVLREIRDELGIAQPQ